MGSGCGCVVESILRYIWPWWMRHSLLILALASSLRIRSASWHIKQFFLYQKLTRHIQIQRYQLMLTFQNLKAARNKRKSIAPSTATIQLSTQPSQQEIRKSQYGTPNHNKLSFNQNNTKSTTDELSRKYQNEGKIITEFELAETGAFKPDMVQQTTGWDWGLIKGAEKCKEQRANLKQFYEFVDKIRWDVHESVRKMREKVIRNSLVKRALNPHQPSISFQHIKDIETRDSVLQYAIKIQRQIDELSQAIPINNDTLHIQINQLNIRAILSSALETLQSIVSLDTQSVEARQRDGHPAAIHGDTHERKHPKKVKRFLHLKTS